ncbi:MAG: helix-turn-helix transcriptional regulator [Solirubrobacteraceae bacterium]|nr:helix-turn-helix transcriptional regulator [Solirubrobacteraceae bacterium]
MSGKAPTRRTRLAPDERRARLLAAAAAEFASRGYDAASLRAIATGAGVTTPIVYDHFGSKAGLYAAVAQEAATSLNASWTTPQGETPEEIFRAMVESIFAWIEAFPHGWRIIFAEPPSDPAVAEVLAVGQADASAAIAHALAAFSVAPPPGLDAARGHAAYAEAMKWAVNGLAAWWWEHRDVPKDTVVAVATDVLWRGLADLTDQKEHP